MTAVASGKVLEASGAAGSCGVGDGLIDLAQPGYWQEDWFRNFLVSGLEREGLGGPACLCLRERLLPQSKDLSSLIALADGVREPSGVEIVAALRALKAKADVNTNCYRRETPEQNRVTAWPNNPKLKLSDPEFYFDIFTDHFYRTPFRFITKDTPIGSAGSCFAVRIAHQLQHWGYNYVIEEDDLPPDVPLDRLGETSFRSGSARSGTLFNVPSMRQMVERAFGEWVPEKMIVHGGAQKITDPFRSVPVAYRDIEGFAADYEAHTSALRRALEKCEVFILTLGLTEAWKFAHSGDFTSIAPHRIDPVLLRRHNLTVEENVAELEKLRDVYRAHRPGIKLVISVSPVPLNKTFSEDSHVVVANSYSKAVLRVAAEIFCRRHPEDSFYFPSYEVVMFGMREPWEEDMRHVSPDAVARVMDLFRKMYLVDQDSELKVLSLPNPKTPNATFRQKVRRQYRRVLRNGVAILKKLGLRRPW